LQTWFCFLTQFNEKLAHLQLGILFIIDQKEWMIAAFLF